MSEGRLPSDFIKRSKRRVNISLSYLIVDARPEFTKEEINTDNVYDAISRRINTLDSVLKSYNNNNNNNDVARSSVFNNETILSKESIKNLKMISKRLPIVIEISEWFSSGGEEDDMISFVLSGDVYGDSICELIDFTHVDTQTWEDNRLNALNLRGDTIGVHYAVLGFTDIVFYPQNKTFRNIIFRLMDTKVIFTEGITVHALTSRDLSKSEEVYNSISDSDSSSSLKHPSLFKISEIERAMEEDSKIRNSGGSYSPFSAYFVPGLTSIRLDKFPKHYFMTSLRCIITKLSHSELLKAVQDESPQNSIPDDVRKKVSEVLIELSNGATTSIGDLSKLSKLVNHTYAQIDAIESESKKQLSTVTAYSLKKVDDFYKYARQTKSVAFVNCFLPNGNIMHVSNAVNDSKIGVSFLTVKRDESRRNLLTLAEYHHRNRSSKDSSSKLFWNSIMVHSSGRFVDIDKKGDETMRFMPDVDGDTLRLMLTASSEIPSSGRDPTIECAKFLTNTLYYNNYNNSNDFMEDIVVITQETIQSPLIRQRLAARLAQSINFSFDAKKDILFPNEDLIEMRKSGGRLYAWHRPISVPLALFKDSVLVNNYSGDVDVQSLDSILEGILSDFIDAVVSSGAWSISGVRDFLNDTVLEGFLYKLIDKSNRIGRSVLSILLINEAARNAGLCSFSSSSAELFDKNTDFFIEPGVSFANHVVSDIPRRLFGTLPATNEQITGVLLQMYNNTFTSSYTKKISTCTTKKCDYETSSAVFSFKLPLELYSTGNVMTVVLNGEEGEEYDDQDMEKLQQEDDDDDVDGRAKTTASSDLHYAVPRALTVVYDNDDGFKSLLDNGDLDALLSRRRHSRGENTNKSDSNISKKDFKRFNHNDVSIREGDKIKHVIVSLPGFSEKKGSEGVDLNENTSKSTYRLKDEENREFVFWDPLLSLSSLRRAAEGKIVKNPAEIMFKNTFNIISDGKIVISNILNYKKGVKSYSSASNNGDSISAPGFAWLWKRFDKTNLKTIEEHNKDNKTGAVMHSKRVDSNTIKKFVSKFVNGKKYIEFSKSIDDINARNNHRQNNNDNKNTPYSSSYNEFSSFAAEKASLTDSKAFLQHDFDKVLTLLITRMMIVVGKDEMEFIEKITNNVSKIMQDSIFIASNDPIKNFNDVMQRVELDSNAHGLAKNSKGLYFSFSEPESIGDAILNDAVAKSFPASSSISSYTATTSSLSSILNEINNRSANNSSNNNNSKGGANSTENTANKNTNSKDLVDFSHLLINMIQDNKRTNMSIQQKRQQQQTDLIIPKFVLNDMPKPSGGSSVFTSGQIIYVPFNPKDIMTDVQWLDILSIVEYSTRDFYDEVVSLSKEQKDIEKRMRQLLSEWHSAMTQSASSDTSTDVQDMRFVISRFEQEAKNLTEASAVASANKGFAKGHYKVVNIDKYNMVVLARSMFDMRFLLKMNNVWKNNNWRGVIETAVGLCFIALKENISRGVSVASRVLLFNDAPETVAVAEGTLRYTV